MSLAKGETSIVMAVIMNWKINYVYAMSPAKAILIMNKYVLINQSLR